MAAADTARLLASMGMDDRGFQQGTRRTLQSVDRIDKRLGAFSGALNRNLGRGLDSAISAVARGAVRVGKGVATAAIDWQDAFQGVVKTVAATPAQFDKIGAALREMSTDMPNTAVELAGIAAAGGQMGVKANDIEAFTKQVAILASTTNVSADDAATALGQLQNVIGLTGNEFDNFAAALVDLGNKGSSTEADILEIERRSGGAAKLIGIAKNATLGWSAAAANLGLNQELAGTALQKFFITTQSVVSSGGKKLNTFAKIAGFTAKGFTKAFRKDASGALDRFVKGLGGLSKADRLKAVQGFFGKGAGMTRLVLGLADSIDKNLNPALADSNKAWKDATAAQAEFDKRNSTVRSAISRLRNGITDAAVTIGEGFTPALGRAADKLSAFLKAPENRAALKSIGEDIGTAIDKIDWDKILGAAKGIGKAFAPALDIITKIAGIISSLPPELIGAGGALLVTNKITGGAVTSGISGIIGGLGSSLAKSLASSIPVFGKAFVQPVFVTNLGPGGLGGGLPGGAGGIGALGKVALVGEALTLAAAVEAVREHFGQQSTDQGNQIETDLQKNIKDPLFNVQQALNGVNQGINDIQSNPLLVLVQGDALDQLKAMRVELQRELGDRTSRDRDKNLPKPATVFKGLKNDGIDLAAIAARRRAALAAAAHRFPAAPQATPRDMDKNLLPPASVFASLKANGIDIKAGLATVGAKQDSARAAFEGGLRGVGTDVNRLNSSAASGLRNVDSTARSGLASTTGSVNTARSAIVGAIASNRPIVNTQVNVNVTSAGVEKSTTTATRYGNQNGSAGGGGNPGRKLQ